MRESLRRRAAVLGTGIFLKNVLRREREEGEREEARIRFELEQMEIQQKHAMEKKRKADVLECTPVSPFFAPREERRERRKIDIDGEWKQWKVEQGLEETPKGTPPESPHKLPRSPPPEERNYLQNCPSDKITIDPLRNVEGYLSYRSANDARFQDVGVNMSQLDKRLELLRKERVEPFSLVEKKAAHKTFPKGDAIAERESMIIQLHKASQDVLDKELKELKKKSREQRIEVARHMEELKKEAVQLQLEHQRSIFDEFLDIHKILDTNALLPKYRETSEHIVVPQFTPRKEGVHKGTLQDTNPCVKEAKKGTEEREFAKSLIASAGKEALRILNGK